MTRPPTAPDDAGLFEHAPCGYVVTDGSGAITAANIEFARLVGLDREEVVGKRTLASFLTVGGRIFLETHLLPMVQHDGNIREVALDLARPDGSRVPVLVNADADDDGGISHLRIVLMEARMRHRYESDLLEATRSAQEARNDATALAQTLQQTLIPPAPPRIPSLSVAASYRPAGDGSVVGGDFYDVFQTGSHSWAVVLGDVSGKGASAAVVTSFLRYTIRALAIVERDPATLLRRLDEAMHENRTDHYATLAVARVERDREHGAWTMELGLAGHPQALVLRHDGSVDEVGLHGTPVGLVSDPSFHTVRHEMGGDPVVLYTDGVTEARSGDRMFGEDGLRTVLAAQQRVPEQITDAITAEVLAYQGGMASDDIAVVSLMARPAP